MQQNTLFLFKKELKKFIKEKFKGKLFFVVIYGSCAYHVEKNDSDIDILSICISCRKKEIDEFINFVKRLHVKYGLKIDTEVPFNKKLVVREDILNAAIKGEGFSVKKGRFFIPPIEKTREFLSSDRVVMRLTLNALTSKNIFIFGDKKYYERKRMEAGFGIARVVFSSRNIEKVNIDEFIDSIMEDERGKAGEDYMGYKEVPRIRSYLIGYFRKVFSSMVKKGILSKKGSYYYRKNREWFIPFSSKI